MVGDHPGHRRESRIPDAVGGRLAIFPPLDPEVAAQVARIEPVTLPSGLIVRPCLARLKDGSLHACVYMVDAAEQRASGTQPPGAVHLPLQLPFQPAFQPQDIASIGESHHRLPARFAREIRAAGESGNGYYIFTVDFGWFRKRSYRTTCVDFIACPMATTPQDAQRVFPREGSPDIPASELLPEWCVYESTAGG